MNLVDVLRHHQRIRPHDVAVVHPAGSATYGQLAAAAAHVAGRLREAGLGPGRTCAVYVNDPLLHLVLLIGLMACGARSFSAHPNAEPVPPGPAVDAYLVDGALPFAATAPVITVSPAWIIDMPATPAPWPAGGFADPREVCRYYASTGASGQPRAIGHTVAALEAMAVRSIAIDPFARGPALSMMWLSTIGGFNTAQATLWHGGTIVLTPPGAALPVLRALSLHRVAMLRASPQQLQVLLQLVQGHPMSFPALEKVETAGAILPHRVLWSARAHLCPNVLSIYGSTEAGLVAQAPGALLQTHPDAAGYVVPGAQVRIVDDAGHELPAGQEGHVRVRTAHLAEGYVGDAVATAAGFPDGWFAPGDIGVLHPDGLLRILGRSDEVINTGGVKVGPTGVEEFLRTLPGVQDAAAFAHRTPGEVDQVWAAVVPGPGFDEAATLAAARERLTSSAPVRLVRLESIPRDGLGRPLRAQLDTPPRA